MRFSIIIPAFNEEANIGSCVLNLDDALKEYDHEFVVVNDGSTDRTGSVIKGLKTRGLLRVVDRPVGDNGIGKAIRSGLRVAEGDFVIITMADSSDAPRDALWMARIASTRDIDCVFGTRFANRGGIVNYPPLKLLVNRLYNHLASALLGIPHDDLSNAFKMYRRQILLGIQLEAEGFDITIEMSVKAFFRAARGVVIIPIGWFGRKRGLPKWKIVREGIVYLRRLKNLYGFVRGQVGRGDSTTRAGK